MDDPEQVKGDWCGHPFCPPVIQDDLPVSKVPVKTLRTNKLDLSASILDCCLLRHLGATLHA